MIKRRATFTVDIIGDSEIICSSVLGVSICLGRAITELNENAIKETGDGMILGHRLEKIEEIKDE